MVAVYWSKESRLIMNIVEIIMMLIPVITFSMGYFLTNISYKRDRR